MSSAAPVPPPEYIYKILPASPPPPDPMPTALPLSALDRRDAFIHLSTSAQLLGTLNSFFASAAEVCMLRIKYSTVEGFIRWEDAKGKGPEDIGGCWDVKGEKGYFPHIYNNALGDEGEENVELGLKLGRGEVESVGVFKRVGEKWSGEGWCWGEDVPS